MKRTASRIAVALLLCAFSVATASAKVKSRNVTFGQDFAVGGTAVKAGTYRLSFDDKSNILTVNDRKTGQAVAQAGARAEARRANSVGLDIQLVGNGTRSLASVTFPEEKVTFTVLDTVAAQN